LPTAAPTEQPSATTEPTATPTIPPTSPPVPTAAPSPSPTAAPAASAGIGVSRARVQQVYEQAGFTFKSSSDVGGQPRVMGSNPQSQSIELIGPPEEITKATVLVGFTGDKNADLQSAVYITGLMTIVAPDWKDGPTWAADQLKAGVSSADGGTYETTFGPHRHSLIVIPLGSDAGALVTYSIESAS
jgi:hypothetical protein